MNRESDRSRRRDNAGNAQAALYRVYLAECRATDEHPRNWQADAEVRIRTNADDMDEDDHHALAAAVFDTLTTDTLAADLTNALADFTCFLVNFKGQSWELVERTGPSDQVTAVVEQLNENIETPALERPPLGLVRRVFRYAAKEQSLLRLQFDPNLNPLVRFRRDSDSGYAYVD